MTTTWPAAQQQYDDVIAVNLAARLVDDAWWMFNDAEAFSLWAIAPKRLRIVAPASAIRRLCLDGHEPRLAAHPAVYAREVFEPRLLPNSYSLVTAAFVATALGAKRIDLYGVDWTEADYMDGVPRNGDRPLRWPIEIGMVSSAFGWLRRRFGVETRRCLPPGHPPAPRQARMLAVGDRELDALGVHVLAPGEIERGRVEFEDDGGKARAVLPPCLHPSQPIATRTAYAP